MRRFDPNLIWLALALIALVALGVVVFLWARRRYRADNVAPTFEDELASYRELLERGQLRPEEFEKIQARLRVSRRDEEP